MAQCLRLRLDCRRVKARRERGEGEFNMRAILGAVSFFLVTTAAWAGSPCIVCKGPAPLLGLGLPAAVAVGGALFGARVLKKK